jgi:hypothetical protein
VCAETIAMEAAIAGISHLPGEKWQVPAKKNCRRASSSPHYLDRAHYRHSQPTGKPRWILSDRFVAFPTRPHFNRLNVCHLKGPGRDGSSLRSLGIERGKSCSNHTSYIKPIHPLRFTARTESFGCLTKPRMFPQVLYLGVLSFTLVKAGSGERLASRISDMHDPNPLGKATQPDSVR